MRVLSLCDGISCGYMALKNIRKRFSYHAVEIDPIARQVSNANFKNIKRPCNDVYQVTKKMVKDLGKIDLILAGPECTSLSSQGKRDDWKGKSVIFFQVNQIIEWVRKFNPEVKVLVENVASMKNIIRTEMTGYLGMPFFLGDSGLTSSQGRKRYYWCNWDIPEIKDKEIMANDVLEDDALHVVAFTKSNRNKKGEAPIVKGRQRSDGKAATITTGFGGRGQSTINYVVTKKLTIRQLTVRESARLQNIPESVDFSIVSDNQAYKCIGNGWEVGMVTEILRGNYE